MSTFLTDLQSVIMTAFVGVIIAYARYVHNLKERVAVMEQTIDDLKQTMEQTKESLEKEIDTIKKRQDSHSRKQDDILNRISSMEKEVLKEMGAMGATISSMGSELKGLSNMLLLFDGGNKANGK